MKINFEVIKVLDLAEKVVLLQKIFVVLCLRLLNIMLRYSALSFNTSKIQRIHYLKVPVYFFVAAKGFPHFLIDNIINSV